MNVISRKSKALFPLQFINNVDSKCWKFSGKLNHLDNINLAQTFKNKGNK